MDDTMPLPAIPGGEQPRDLAGSEPHGHHAPLGTAARALEAFSGVVSGGLVVVGLALIVLQFLAPELAPGSGLTAASGPGWGRAVAQLGVGIVGELLVWARPRLSHGVRVWCAVMVLAAAAAVLWLCWWQ